MGAIYQSDVTMEDHVIICSRKQSVAVPGNVVAGGSLYADVIGAEVV